jgi:benzoate membrane transport protein
MLITSAAGVSMPEAIGAFVACALLIAAAGFSGWFERAMARVPMSIASGMLAGVLLRFGLDGFVAMQARFALVFAMTLAWLLARRWLPRYAVPLALATGVAIAAAQGLLRFEAVRLEFARPGWTTPAFSWQALVGGALPLFVVTMASQNVPGVAVLRACGYGHAPVSRLLTVTGVATLLLAPFGAFALNLAAISAALCMGPEAHPDPRRRWLAAAAAGGFYLAVAAFAGPLAALFAALPRELVVAVAGLALLPTIGRGLQAAVANDDEREPALVTFLVTASGLTLWGIGSAFWGVVFGVAALLAWRPRA